MGEVAQKFISGESEDEAETSDESSTNKEKKQKKQKKPPSCSNSNDEGKSEESLKKINVEIVWYFIDDFDSSTISNIH